MSWKPIGLMALLILGGCTAQQAGNLAMCSADIKKTLEALPPGSSNTEKAYAAGQAAAVSPGCIGLSADSIQTVSGLRSKNP